ncbi:hypothetical protein B0J12DRAFT_750400 [Macrophomina phaseolina]|uniref:Uncharacterized protein n=1 Tax=Macrophomina phaseolina TaxID=35725 RepID=A0ABQ8GZ10_9PEZI|nr:hypothetical protein B0J12DRAFT_750400 [Macrophomina phaseolina]
MYYHAAILLLFRPFLKARFTESNLSPGDVCRQSANSVSGIFAQYRQQYGLLGIFAFQLHLAAAYNSFQDLTEQSQCATSSLNIIRSLVQRWKIVLPLEVDAALYRDQNALDAPNSGAAASSDIHFSNSSSADYGTPPALLELAPPEVMQKRHLLAPRQTHKEGLRDINNYLFTPVPNQSTPLLGPIHTSTSHNGGREGGGGDTMWNDELNKVPQGFDGLGFVRDNGFDPVMGYQGA